MCRFGGCPPLDVLLAHPHCLRTPPSMPPPRTNRGAEPADRAGRHARCIRARRHTRSSLLAQLGEKDAIHPACLHAQFCRACPRAQFSVHGGPFCAWGHARGPSLGPHIRKRGRTCGSDPLSALSALPEQANLLEGDGGAGLLELLLGGLGVLLLGALENGLRGALRRPPWPP